MLQLSLVVRGLWRFHNPLNTNSRPLETGLPSTVTELPPWLIVFSWEKESKDYSDFFVWSCTIMVMKAIKVKSILSLRAFLIQVVYHIVLGSFVIPFLQGAYTTLLLLCIGVSILSCTKSCRVAWIRLPGVNSSCCDSRFYNGTSCYHKMEWLQYI